MKKTIIIVLWVMSLFAQNTKAQDTIIKKEIDEEYLVKLFQHADIIFCKVDDVGDLMYIKNIEVEFPVDSSVFRTAYIVSNTYSSTISEFIPPWCTYVRLDDGYGGTLKLTYEIMFTICAADEEPLNAMDILRPILDSLLQHTDIVDYSGDTKIMLDIDEDE